MTWEITEEKLDTLIEWYASNKVLVEEYEDKAKKEKRIALNVLGEEMEELDYHERVGMIMGYEDCFRMLGVYPRCVQVIKAMNKFKKENDYGANF